MKGNAAIELVVLVALITVIGTLLGGYVTHEVNLLVKQRMEAR